MRMNKVPLKDPGWVCHDELGEELGSLARALSDNAVAWPFLYGVGLWS